MCPESANRGSCGRAPAITIIFWCSRSLSRDFAEAMAQLQRINLDFSKAIVELAEFREFLQDNTTFSERKVVAELKKRPHLSCLIGFLQPSVPRADAYKFEFQIQGVFRADLVVGNLQFKRFVLVEFEGGQDTSVFGPKGTNQMRDWSRHLEHGFGQLVDWAWAIQDACNTQMFKSAFECEDPIVLYLLVCGRDAAMKDGTEERRFAWRSQSIILDGKIATCLTYDGLFRFLESTLEAIKSYH